MLHKEHVNTRLRALIRGQVGNVPSQLVKCLDTLHEGGGYKQGNYRNHQD